MGVCGAVSARYRKNGRSPRDSIHTAALRASVGSTAATSQPGTAGPGEPNIQSGFSSVGASGRRSSSM